MEEDKPLVQITSFSGRVSDDEHGNKANRDQAVMAAAALEKKFRMCMLADKTGGELALLLSSPMLMIQAINDNQDEYEFFVPDGERKAEVFKNSVCMQLLPMYLREYGKLLGCKFVKIETTLDDSVLIVRHLIFSFSTSHTT